MRRSAVVHKRMGETPLQALEAFRARERLGAVPLTYAGRLDPMASGALLILIGEECKKRGAYDALDKEYEFELLLGFRSDTGDVLGLAESVRETKLYTHAAIQRAMQSVAGAQTLPYPAYSSKTVDGKPLFQHAHDRTLDAIEMPETKVRIYRMQYAGARTVPKALLSEHILHKLDQLHAAPSERPGSDFRRGDIAARWMQLKNIGPEKFTVLKFRATVSSGTYIRSIAPRLAESLGTGGLAYSIRRTKIGRYLPLAGNLGLWWKSY